MVDAAHRAHAFQQHAVDGRADHKRLRDIVDGAFRRRAVLDMEPHIRAIGDGPPMSCLPKAARPTSSSAFARKLPLSVICELLRRLPIVRNSSPGPAASLC